MAAKTEISWADSTCNLWIGCVEVTPACDHCYARELAERYGWVKWGADRIRCAQGWKDARKFQRAANDNGGVDPQLGRRRRVFVNSLSDFFDNHKSIVWREEAWQLMRECPDVIFMLLTKRPENVEKMLPPDWGTGWDNVWIGTTVEDQKRANHRIPILLAVPAAVHFVSMEPLMGEVDLTKVEIALTGPSSRFPAAPPSWRRLNALTGENWTVDHKGYTVGGGPRTRRLAWVVTGGESGAKARPSRPAWFHKLRDDCERFGVPFHFKQWGEWADMGAAGIFQDGPVTTSRGHVKDWMRRRVHLADGTARTVRGHSFTPHATELVYRVGRTKNEPKLDGREHLEFPEDVRIAA